MAAAVTRFYDFSEQLARGTHLFHSHTFKLALCASANAPVATNAVLTDLTQISYANFSGTAAPTVPSMGLTESTGTTTITANQVVITATGAATTFRYYVLYNDSAASKNLICFWNHGSDVTLALDETFTIKFNNTATAGTIFTISQP